MVAGKRQLLQQFVLSAFLLCLCYSANGVQCFKEKKLLKLQQFRWRPHGRHARTTITACLSHKSRREKGAAILEIKHKDDCSGTGKVVDWNKKQRKRLVLDDVHVRTLQFGFKNKVSGSMKDVSDAQILLTSGARLQTLNYIVTVELEGRNMTLIVDACSDLTWVQCQPCKLCYNQQESLFNPSASSSYKSVLCNSSTCQSLQFDTGNPGACESNPMSCNYVVKYGDGSYTHGELGSDRLSLGTAPVTNFVFGCGRNNKGLFGGTSGLMGLGRSESVSVVIGGVTLQASSFASGGILIDSGTVISRLPPSVYKAVKTEFLKQFYGYPMAPGFFILDSCFNLSAYQEVNIPTLKFHYEGDTEMNVHVIGIFYLVQTDGSQICLALASISYEYEIAIIGNYQQKNQRVIYNTKDSKPGFAEESCSFTLPILDPTSPREVDHICLICTCPPPYSMRHFGTSLGSIGILKLSEFA
ncbi:hypothetical protein DVH24_006039 [Malus domestica]|uniref:Peptidase A1 domain-containing protein n=1 Tax=Malus domestica TaxID=3750 RepID=A0A498IKA8_MALDO|nr:hypothetical protein DVH24_006039 [Malus domestica]